MLSKSHNLCLVSWAPACLTWSRLNKHLAPFLQWMLCSGVLCVQWKDSMLRKAVASRYNVHTEWANKMLYDYYMVKIVVFIDTIVIILAKIPTYTSVWFLKKLAIYYIYTCSYILHRFAVKISQ